MAVAPWVLALALVVSVTAEAGQDPSLGVSVAPQASAKELASPVRQALLSTASGPASDLFARASVESLDVEARLTLGSPDDLASGDDEIEPRADLKRARSAFPMIDRSAKGDPFIGVRPGFDARLKRRSIPGAAESLASEGDSALDFSLDPSPPTPSDDRAEPRDPAEGQKSFSDGATPGVPLDIALNSATPTPNDGALLIVAAKAAPETTLAPKDAAGGPPNYAALIDPKDSVRQQRCLAEAIYFEARSEPETGQAAVAQVVLNRVRSGIFPTNVCGVVYQDRNRPFACQFSFACEGRSLRVEEPGPWAVAVRIANDVVSGASYNPQVGDAINYHANYVTPYWARTLQRVDQIGHHIFYRLRVGQN
jgi:spore germination cell wall hydrolase CwlJ-like protein